VKMSSLIRFVVYSDGGCLSNGTLNSSAYGSFSVFAFDGEGNKELNKNARFEYPDGGNNVAELMTALNTLKYIDELFTRLGKKYPITLHIDSKWVHGQLCSGHKLKTLMHLQQFKDEAKALIEKNSVDVHWLSGVQMKKVLGH
jgi:ribonuclease HI